VYLFPSPRILRCFILVEEEGLNLGGALCACCLHFGFLDLFLLFDRNDLDLNGLFLRGEREREFDFRVRESFPFESKNFWFGIKFLPLQLHSSIPSLNPPLKMRGEGAYLQKNPSLHLRVKH